MDYANLPEYYSRLDKQFTIKNADIDAATYTNVDSNFVFSSNYPRHRWFNYKEGFSLVLVERIFNEYGLTKESIDRFIQTVASRDELLSEFDPQLWLVTIDYATVMKNGDLRFRFYDGTEVIA